MAFDAVTALFEAYLRNDAEGDRDVQIAWSISSPQFESRLVTLTQNTTTSVTGLHASATLLVLIPPTTNTQAIRIDDASGKKLGAAIPTILPLAGDTTVTFHLAAGSNVDVKVLTI